MQARQIDATAELQRSLDVLVKNWVLAIPSALASLLAVLFIVFVVAKALVGITTASLASGDQSAIREATAAVLALVSSPVFILGTITILVVLVLANVMTIVLAQDAWEGRPPDFGRAISLTVRKLPDLIVAGILIALLAIIPALLSIFGIGLLLLVVLGFFMMYVTPAIVLGNRSGAVSLRESFRLVRSNLGKSLLAFIAIIVVALIGQVITSIAGHIPVLNFIAGLVVGGFTTAYTALVSARFYEALSGREIAAPPPQSLAV